MRRIFRNLFARGTTSIATRPTRSPRHRLLLNSLEDRCVPATFTVNVATDTSGVPTGSGTGLVGDLRYCIDQANTLAGADVIDFDAVVFAGASTITIDAILTGMGITGDLTINGPAAKLTLSGGGVSDILASSGDTVTLTPIAVSLNNLTLDSGNLVASSGNAFFGNLTNLTMTGVTVSNNTGEFNGAAVLITDGSITATNCSFIGNTLGNSTAGFAGAAVGLIGKASTASFDTCTFTGNKAVGGVGFPCVGGAFGTIGNTGDITFKNTTISTSSATGLGGGIYIDLVSKLTINSSTISLNSAGSSGGGIFAGNGATVIIDKSTISGNTTPINGGGVYVGDDTATATIGTLTVTNSSFTGNKISKATAGRLGGGVCLVDAATGSFTDTTFDSNSAVGATSIGCSGSAIGLFSTGSVTITKCQFNSNDAGNENNIVAGNSAIFQNTGAAITIDQSSFTKNTSDSAGGAIFLNLTGKAGKITNSTFDANITGNSGGALSGSATNTGGSLLIQNCTFTGNSAAGNGGAIRFFGGWVAPTTIQNCTIVGNTAAGVGGGVAAGGGTNTWALNSTIVAQNLAGGSKTSVTADLSRTATTQTVTCNFCLIGNKGTTPIYTGANNQEGTPTTPLNPNLTALGSFGGFTKTMLPTAASTAVLNKGANIGGLTTDQRGAGFKRDWDGSGAPDIGAVEIFNPSPFVSTFNAPTVTAGGPSVYQFTITFADNNAINVSSLSTVGAVTVSGGKFGSPVNAVFKSVDVNTNGTPRTATFEVTPPGGTLDFSDNGIYNINITAGTIFDTDAPTPLSVSGGLVGTFTIGIGASLVVNATNDESVDTDTLTSLREAMITANSPSFAGHDTITFDPTVFASPATITMDPLIGSLLSTGSLTIIGPTGKVTLDAGFQTSRHMKLNGPGTLDINISNMTFMNGYTKSNAFGENGGSLNIGDENVTITNCSFEMNSSQLDGAAIGQQGGNLTISKSSFTNNSNNNDNGSGNFSGGAVLYSGSGTLSIGDSTFTTNTAFASGGAVFALNASKVTITNSTFSGNKSQGDGSVGGAVLFSGVTTASITDSVFTANEQTNTLVNGGAGGAVAVIGNLNLTIDRSSFKGNIVADGEGGAIWTRADAVPTITITNSTISGNSSNQANAGSGGGGGIFLGGGGTLTITNSTIANNVSALDGGGIEARGNSTAAVPTNAVVAIRNSTVAFNTATAPVSGGGGITLKTIGAGGSLTLSSTIVAKNISTISADINADAATNVLGNNNFVGDTTGSVVTFANAPLTGDPLFAVAGLTNNGGPTETIAIQATSPAKNTGNNSLALATDQRGGTNIRSSGLGTDIGAFEFQDPASAAKVTAVTINSTKTGAEQTQRSRVFDVAVTFDSPVTFTTTAAAAFTLTKVGGGSVALAASVSGNTVTLTFTGGSVDNVSLADGRYDLVALKAGFAGAGIDGTGPGDATAGDDYNLTQQASPNPLDTTRVFRLFGDFNGDGTVAANDFIAFRLALGGNSAVFDFDNDGAVATSDFIQFRLRFGGSI